MKNDILVDTDVLIDLSRGVNKCFQFFDRLPDDIAISISVISKMEVLSGCQNKSQQKMALKLLRDFKVLPIESEDAFAACDIYEKYHLSHGIGILDCLLAACAIVRRMVFYTRNTKHFEMVPNLMIKTPYQIVS